MLSAFSMAGFVKQAQRLSAAVASESSSDEEQNHFSDSSDDSEEFGNKFFHQAAARSYRERMFDFSTVGPERMWLKNLLLSETETESEISDVDDYIQQMLQDHVWEKKIRERYNDSPQSSHYGYYSAGLLSDNDLFPEHGRSVAGKRKCKMDHGMGKTKGVRKKMKLAKKRGGPDGTSSSMRGPMFGDKNFQKLLQLHSGRSVTVNPSDDGSMEHTATDPDESPIGKRGRKMRMKTPEALNIRRRKMWQLMAKKEVGKLQRAKANNHKDTITNCRRVAALCMRVARQKAMQSQKLMKDTVWRAKRLTREMQVYWKRYDKVERETKRRMEREAEEQRKIDVEIVEAKRQQRKLNFLITQTELYAHFMSRKLGNVSAEEQLKILSQLDEESNPRLAAIDNYDCERMKQLAQKNATEAFRSERARTNQFDVHSMADSAASSPSNEPARPLEESKGNGTFDVAPASITEPSTGIAELPQPSMFRGRLKGYQLKGVAWLANLYDQGISGILADEMGLGKTVQSIAFLCHIAEHYGVWGPFLVISPASTLHNWQQEMERFVPEFNVVPYWGSPNERKILRQFWEQKHLHTKDASFHVVITSYQLVVTDYKYFNRIKWQYMVLDEAQAIKSSSSMRWKLLLGFNCRNRLLLSGTPIQNSMAELWALLHFIMPTLFDSHEEFNEWFSKDIESHAENKTGIDEKQISRLHMILKPFMLRRIKKDVENELSDKIEIMVYCPLTTRQKLLYVALKKEICIEDLLHLTTVGGGGGGGSGDGQSIDRNFTSNLMNLVMQFRKVCNHPELFERRDVRSPFCMKWSYELAERPIFRRQLLMEYTVPSKRHWLYNRCYIFKALQVQRSMARDNERENTVPVPMGRSKAPKQTHYDDWCMSFSCARLAGGLSPQQVEQIARRNVFWFMYQLIEEWVHWITVLHFRWIWSDTRTNGVWTDPRYMLLEPSAERWTTRCFPWKAMDKLLFTHTIVHSTSIPVYTHCDHVLHFTSETLDHRIMRSRKQQIPGQPLTLLPEVPFLPSRRLSTVLPNEPTAMPKFLCRHYTKVLNTTGCTGPALRPVYTHRLACGQSFNDATGAAERKLREHVHASYPAHGWSNIIIPDKQTLVSDAGKLAVLDSLLARLKEQGHRVLIYSQMTKMIDLLEEYMWHRKHRYMRLDGSSKISERRDMVADFQNRADIFVFLLSTRAGGLGINLTAADTVIFYDSDWNPTVDQQAMDRAHRLGQTKQVTVYRLICKGTIEERILQRAREKSEIQRMVINGDNFKPDTLKPKEVVSLLLDDEEIELKYRQKTEERRLMEDPVAKSTKERDRKQKQSSGKETVGKDRKRLVETNASCDEPGGFGDSAAPSPAQSERSNLSDNTNKALDALDESSNEASSMSFDMIRERDSKARPAARGGSKRGRPRGSRRGGAVGSGSTRPAAVEQHAEKDTSSSMSAVPLPAPVATIAQVRRGPGRPRLKTNGPSNQGTRGPHVRQTIRIRKPIGPLVVPLGGQTTAATAGGNRLLSASPSNRSSKPAAPSSSPASTFPHSASGSSQPRFSAEPSAKSTSVRTANAAIQDTSQTVPSSDNLVTDRQQSIPPIDNDSGSEFPNSTILLLCFIELIVSRDVYDHYEHNSVRRGHRAFRQQQEQQHHQYNNFNHNSKHNGNSNYHHQTYCGRQVKFYEKSTHHTKHTGHHHQPRVETIPMKHKRHHASQHQRATNGSSSSTIHYPPDWTMDGISPGGQQQTLLMLQDDEPSSATTGLKLPKHGLSVWPVKREAVVEGDLILGGLMMVHSREDSVTCGPIMPQGGIQALETMLYTLDKINEQGLVPNVTIGAHILDDCDKDTYGLEMAVDFIKGSISNIDDINDYDNCSKGHKKKIISGVVGAASSVTSIQVANLLRLFKIPQVSFFSTSPELSNKQRFEYFSRTIPSDHYQVKAIVDIVQKLGWSYISIIYEESNYGIKAFEELDDLLSKHSICIAVKEKLVKDSGVADTIAYDNIVLKLLTKPRAKGVIIFGSDQEVAEVMKAVRRQNVTGLFSWIGSDGWSARNLVSDGNEAEVEGTLSVQPQANPVLGFEDYFLNLTVINNKRNPWFVEFWENNFQCKYPNSPSTPYNKDYKKECSTTEKLAKGDLDFEDQLQFVSDAVMAFGYAFKNMHQELCRGKPGLCDAMNPTKGSELLKYLRKADFIGLSGDRFNFDVNGDGPARYNIIHFKQVAPERYKWIKVGEYYQGELRLNMQDIQFRTKDSMPPESVCSRPCERGQAKKYVEGEGCCWHCFNCTQYQIRSPNDETHCVNCPRGTLPDVYHEECQQIPESYLRPESFLAIGAMTFSSFGILITFFVIGVFLKHNDTPIVRASGRELSYVLLSGILLCFGVTYTLVIKPNDIVCGVQRFWSGFSFTVVYAALLTKTNRIARIFNASTKSAKRPSFISPHSQLVICGILVSFQILINAVWMIVSPAHAMHYYPTREDNLLVCNSYTDASYMIAFFYPIFLIVICTVYAVLTRKTPEAFNESKYIGFTMYTTCVIWLAFIPLYFGTANNVQLRIFTMSMTISLSATVTLVCLFSPKLYIILIRPERNIRQSMMPIRYSTINKTTGSAQSSVMAAVIVTAATCNENEKVIKSNSNENIPAAY
ncbi:chromatin-remodeling ATPase INO80-like [Anopheles maculipalpis]|uniref:chromatin-remodeling ATPase INO80-like n=1 Tax=Anopheles maculipalpis TaxID=1496333 RepID=UPI0021598C9B|nr:chromatin-remodeling ATPase INO80-like [Anopheles maculipalpis]